MGLTTTFSIAKRGLQIAQAAIEVISHNIANANTEGYSRQRINLTTPDPYATRIGAVGTGVDADNISRQHDQYIQRMLVDKTSDLAKSDAQKLSIDALESIFNESMGHGINEALSEFWNAWQEVANNPEGNPERMGLLEKADTLTNIINQMRLDMDDIKYDINRRVEEAIIQANTLIREIAAINGKIVPLEAAGHPANDLRDKRDLHIKELAEYLDINYFEDPATGSMFVMTPKGTPLVEENIYWTLKASADRAGDIHLMWERGQGGEVDITEYVSHGQLGGWLELRDQLMDEFYDQFEAFTQGLIKEVNRQHTQGVGLKKFTDLTSTYDISSFAQSYIRLEGDDNDIILTARQAGASGDKIQYAFVKAAAPSSPLSATVSTDAAGVTTITITLATDAANHISTRAVDLVDYINSDTTFPNPGFYVEASLPGDQNGQGLVTDTSTAIGLTLLQGDNNATLTTDLAGADNDLTFTASALGLLGEEVRVEYIDPLMANQNLSVSVINNVIKVSLKTGANGEITSTAAQIMAAVNAHPEAGNLVTAALAAGNPFGNGVVTETVPYVSLNRHLDNVLEFGSEIEASFPEYARYETAIDGQDNDLVFTAAGPGASGDEVSIRYVNPGAASQTLGVVTDLPSKAITINLATDANGDVITTASDILDLINYGVGLENDEARSLVSVSLAAGNSGAGLVPNTNDPLLPKYLNRATSFDLVSYDNLGRATITSISVNPGDTREDLVEQINNITGLTASIQIETGNNHIQIKAESGYGFAFANDTSAVLMALGLNTFFEGHDTLTIKVNDLIQNDLSLAAAGRIDANGQAPTGDNTNALDIADVKDQKFLFRGQLGTISDAYNTLSASVGATTYSINRSYDFDQSLLDQVQSRRDSISAVNLDEEVADMMKFQYMYQASAKMISITDELLAILMAVK